MKKISLIIISTFILLFTFQNVSAQAFAGKGSKYFTASIGVSKYFHFDRYGLFDRNFYDNYGFGYRYSYFSPTLSLNANVEIGVAKYVGVAPSIGFSSTFYYGGDVGIDIPMGVQGNFHFLQLIADKTGKSFADKLDVYAGVNIGGGPSILVTASPAYVYGFMYAGPQLGVRYYPTSNIGLTAEVGFGKSIANFGMVMKMGK